MLYVVVYTLLYVVVIHPVKRTEMRNTVEIAWNLSSVAVCCILSVLLWRYPDDGRNSDRNMYVIYNAW